MAREFQSNKILKSNEIQKSESNIQTNQRNRNSFCFTYFLRRSEFMRIILPHPATFAHFFGIGNSDLEIEKYGETNYLDFDEHRTLLGRRSSSGLPKTTKIDLFSFSPIL